MSLHNRRGSDGIRFVFDKSSGFLELITKTETFVLELPLIPLLSDYTVMSGRCIGIVGRPKRAESKN